MGAINWVDWYEQPPMAVEYLEQAQTLLRQVGFTDEPDTVLEVARHLLSDPDAARKLRALADAWESQDVTAPWLKLVQMPG